MAKVLFIGSPEVGKKVMAVRFSSIWRCYVKFNSLKTASETLKPVILELGGKDPFIVLAPADVQTAVDRAINGSFFNLGQNCISAERILVDRSLYDECAGYAIEPLTCRN